MPVTIESRKGQFIWLPPKPRELYLRRLKRRIEHGYYSSERVILQITEKLAPVFNDNCEKYI